VQPPPQYGAPGAHPPQHGHAPPPDYGYGAPGYGAYGAPPPQYGHAPPPGYGYGAPGYGAPGYGPSGYGPPGYGPTGGYAKKPKSKIAAGLLAVLLGYGIYNFYLKYYLKAIIQLVATLVASGLMLYWSFNFSAELITWTMNVAVTEQVPTNIPIIFGPVFVIATIISSGIGIWHLIEGILIFCGKINRDGAGDPIA